MKRRRRAAFLTIGQSPRPDILDEMRPQWGDHLDVEEHGALDALSDEDIDALAPNGREPRLVSRLRDGSGVVVRASFVEDRVVALAKELDGRVDFVVLLCTGHFPAIDTRIPCLRAQAIVDHALAAFADSGCRLGVLVPLREQAENFALPLLQKGSFAIAHASPYEGSGLPAAARSLADCDVLALHCMGYTRAHQKTVETETARPALLARELVATAVSRLLGRAWHERDPVASA